MYHHSAGFFRHPPDQRPDITVTVEGNLKRRAAILLYADPRPGTGRGWRAPRAHTVIRSSQRPVSRHAESRKRDSGCANGAVSATHT